MKTKLFLLICIILLFSSVFVYADFYELEDQGSTIDSQIKEFKTSNIDGVTYEDLFKRSENLETGLNAKYNYALGIKEIAKARKEYVGLPTPVEKELVVGTAPSTSTGLTVKTNAVKSQINIESVDMLLDSSYTPSLKLIFTDNNWKWCDKYTLINCNVKEDLPDPDVSLSYNADDSAIFHSILKELDDTKSGNFRTDLGIILDNLVKGKIGNNRNIAWKLAGTTVTIEQSETNELEFAIIIIDSENQKTTYGKAITKQADGLLAKSNSYDKALDKITSLAIKTGGIPSSIIQQLEKAYEWHDTITEEAEANGISVSLMYAIILQESGANKDAVSPTGCSGLMQLCSGTAKGTNVFDNNEIVNNCSSKSDCPDDPRFDPELNIKAGAKVLKEKIAYFKDYTAKEQFGIAAYNGGQLTIKKAIDNTGKADPIWEEVKPEITAQLLNTINEFTTSSWNNAARLKKQEEIRNYVDSVTLRKSHAEAFLAAKQ
jgi:hypothetical protein